jgi:hypothetical protein
MYHLVIYAIIMTLLQHRPVVPRFNLWVGPTLLRWLGGSFRGTSAGDAKSKRGDDAKGQPAHGDTARTGTPNPPDYPLLSTQDISTTMNKVHNAIADLESRDHVEPYTYDEVAREYGCSRSAVSRRWRGVSRPRADCVADSLAFPPQQESALIEYVAKLHIEGLAPTREMVRNLGSEIAGRELSERWIGRFIERHHDRLLTQWGPSIDRVRHQADSFDKYDSYFDLLYEK